MVSSGSSSSVLNVKSAGKKCPSIAQRTSPLVACFVNNITCLPIALGSDRHRTHSHPTSRRCCFEAQPTGAYHPANQGSAASRDEPDALLKCAHPHQGQSAGRLLL